MAQNIGSFEVVASVLPLFFSSKKRPTKCQQSHADKKVEEPIRLYDLKKEKSE
jgi:hypothetical protein